VELRTERLDGAPPNADDADRWEGLLRSPDVERWLRPHPLQPFRRIDTDAVLARDVETWAAHGFGPWAVWDRAARTFVGRIGLSPATVDGAATVELAWALLPAQWGKGYAAEAATGAIAYARAQEIPELVARTLPHNEASRRVMERIGLELVGPTTHAGLPHVLYRLPR
jgi:[ribosomal protein S5]-alanine N-acetyltransferase